MKSVQLLGIIGSIVFLFGILTSFFVASDEYYFAYAHILLGAGLFLFFLLRGGAKVFHSLAVKRACAFGAGATIYSGLFAGILILANVFTYRHDPLHFDSTEQKIYTLAPQTKQVLSALDKEVVVRGFFVGGEVPVEVRDLLDLMARSADKFSWRVVDPEKRPELVQLYGINERDTLHFSFAEGDKTRAAKIVRDLSEQEIVNALLKLTRGAERKVCAISGHGEADLKGDKEGGFLFLKEAINGENIKVEELQLLSKGSVPKDCSAVALMAPRKELAQEEKKILSAYLAKGGSALFLSEPNTTSDIAELVRPLGIIVGNDVVLDKITRSADGASVGARPLITTYVKHEVTEGFNQPTIFTTVSSVRLESDLPKGVEASELALTSDKSWAETNLSLLFSDSHEAALEDSDIAGPVPVAAAYQRSLGTGEKSGESKKSRVIVFGDADFVTNVNIRQFFNRDFLLNSLNWVLGQEQGVSIRARTLRESTKGLSDEQFRSMFLLAGVLLPEFVVLFGFIVWWTRAK